MTSQRRHRGNRGPIQWRGLGRAAVLACLVAAAGLAPSGCAMDRRGPEVIMNQDQSLDQYKRFERDMQRDFLHHISRTAYHRGRDSDYELINADQCAVLKEWGRPDYIRKPFRDLEERWIEEWVYFGKNHVFQFSDHALVYEGEVTDLEQLLLRLGYPDRTEISKGESGLVKHFMYYERPLTRGRQDSYELANGWIVYSFEGH